MLSKITIDVDSLNRVQILIKYIPSEDLRDRLVRRFIEGVGLQNGYVSFRIEEERTDGQKIATLIPVPPLIMEKELPVIVQ